MTSTGKVCEQIEGEKIEGGVQDEGEESLPETIWERRREGAQINFKPVTPPPVCQFHFGPFLCSDFSVWQYRLPSLITQEDTEMSVWVGVQVLV